MKNIGKKLMIAVGTLFLVLVVGISLTAGWRPFLGPKARALSGRTFLRTPQRLARGKYLVESVDACMDCHSQHDWTQHDAPIVQGTKGAGQDFSMLKGLPGHIVAPNLTPDPETGSGTWSDDALTRAIREGIGHDGRGLFPLMPYQHFRELPDEDIASIVVYLRSLPPVRNPLPKTEVGFPVNHLMLSAPEPITSVMAQPDVSDPVKRGRFLVNAAACADCHTPHDKGQPLPGMDFAGGFVLEGPWGRVASANLTPDPSGIPYYDEARFVQTLRTGYVGARELNQIMPWSTFRNMTDEDLKSIYAYLKTLQPVRHRVDNSLPPTYCKVCRQYHGGGDLNE
jgi:mono/diheme cytochrome c family protein